jgi:hypothetical protein
MNEGDQNDRPAADSRDAAARAPGLAALYEQDETAWLETMSRLAAEGRHAEMDFRNLAEYLADMARRDRREVKSRLVALLRHRLRWEHQPGRRSGLWQSAIRRRRRELRQLLESATLYRHAEAVLADAYAEARPQAADEIGLPPDAFPAACRWGLGGLLRAEEGHERG